MKGIFSGRQIKDLKGRSQKVTRSQTATNAIASITAKYGGVEDNAHYYHIGKGVWKKYSLENDKKRTGKLAESKSKWAERPHKLDWEGIDTKQGPSKGPNKGPSKGPSKKFSVSNLKSGKLTKRSNKNLVSKRTPVLKQMPKKFTYNSRLAANAADLAADYKARGHKSVQTAYGEFVKDRALKPELSAGEFAKVFSMVTPAKFQEKQKIEKKVKADIHTIKHSPEAFKLPVKKISLSIPESKENENRDRSRLLKYVKSKGFIKEIDNERFLNSLNNKQLRHLLDNYTDYQKPFEELPRFTYEIVGKPRFSTSQLKQGKLSGRKSKAQLKISHEPVMRKHTPVTKSIQVKPKATVYKGFLVTGNTYPLKNQLKAMGGKWVKDEGGWAIPVKSAKEINKLAKEKKLKVIALKTEENVFKRLTEAERLDIRKAKYERKAERWGKSAVKLEKESEMYYKQSRSIMDAIPFGQPVLVGHHSEKADRNRRDKAWNLLGKSAHASDAAKEKSRKSRIISNVADRLGTDNDLKGRISNLAREYLHAKNKIAQAERDLEFARIRKDTDDIERQKKTITYWQNKTENLNKDIESLKARLPAEALEKPTYGITMTMLGGTKLKPAVGATSVAKRYHNKNLKGGNFAIEVRKGNIGVELHGYHDPDGIIYSLSVGPLYGIGTSVITKENYKSFEMSKLVNIIKRALETTK